MLMRRRRLWIALLVALLILVPAGWYLLSPVFLTDTVADSMPESVQLSVLLAQGQFKDGETFHKGEGNVRAYRLPDGRHLLRFENFKVTNGPELHVFLADNPAPAGKDDLPAGGFVDLGRLKGNAGDQNYFLPVDLSPQKFGSVVIYCLPFQVVFSTAKLEK